MKRNLLLSLFLLLCIVLKAQTDENLKAINLVSNNKIEIGLSEKDLKNFIVSDSYFDNTTNLQMVYLQQTYLGIPVYNQIQGLAFKNGKIVSNKGGRIPAIEKYINDNSTPAITAEMAVLSALTDRKISTNKTPIMVSIKKEGRLFVFDDMGVSRENITSELMWVPLKDGKKIVLAWQVYIIPKTTSDYWLVRVNANDNSIVGVSNLTVFCNWDHKNENKQETHVNTNTNQLSLLSGTNVSEENKTTSSPSIINGASYRVIPYPAESPNHTGGSPAVRTNPWTNAPGNASTLNWHSTGTADYTITRGNNVWAQEDRNNNNGIGTPGTSTTTTDPLNFEFTPSFTVTPTQTTPVPNQQFNITNLFYWNNIVHDIMYQYGFNEVSGNFQANNLGRGGQENDYVLADAQDGGGTNNANFSTPADGGNGRMQMYLWSGNPQKDGDVDNGIITHEAAHGISNRLTGGPSQAGCLQNDEQMGEGWSDYYGLMLTQNWLTSTLTTGYTTPRGIGTYATGQASTATGIRSQRYCTNFSVNNKVYAATIPTAVHDRGEIWCAALWDMTWNIINQVGTITSNLYDGTGSGGNVIAFRLVTEGMKLQPCSPGFIDGRDAILQADQLLYGGVHQCAIWEAFRRRGMGAFASQGSSGSVTDQVADFTLGSSTLQLTQSITQIPEGQNITFTNTLTTDNCGGITNFILTDTLPTNVTYVSGGTYNSANRVVSFPVNMPAGQTQTYSFTVLVNTGSYYPTVTLFQDSANGPISSNWTGSNTQPTGIWSVSNARAFSPTTSYFSNNLDTTSDQRLTLNSAISMGATPPPLTFRYWLNSESTYDGGVLEASINNGNTWTDMQPNIIQGGYLATMDATTLLSGRKAWSGSSNNKWIKTKVNLAPYANTNLKIRFRFTSDVGTNLEGWYVDDIAIKNQAVVEMQSNLYTAANIRVAVSDTFNIILPSSSCTGASISTDPVNTNACEGSNASFSTTAAGSNNTYQWQVSTNGGVTYTNIAGANSTTYGVTAVTSGQNNNRYRVIVSNPCPSTDTSLAGILTVSTPASISSQPVSQTVCQGAAATFSVLTNSVSNTYQWQVSTDNGATFTNISGATSATLSLSNITTAMNNNQYHVVVGSCLPSGLISTTVTLTVNSPAAIISQPTTVSACAGANATFTVSCSGTNVTYQWQISTDGGNTYSDIPGETNPTLILNNVSVSMNNNSYQLVAVSSSCPDFITSNPAILTISNNAVITAQPINATICSGNNTTVTVNAIGTGLTYQWQVSTDGGLTYANISGATSASLDITNVSSSMNGNMYHAVISNACAVTGLISDASMLTVLAATLISSQPANATSCINSTAVFSTSATGTSISYQWQVSTDGGLNYTNIAGETNSTLAIASISSSMNNNKYRVIITSLSCDAVTSNSVVLSVSTPASINAQPSNVSACENATATISATASGTSISYQWQVSTDGGVTYTNITGANAASLTLNNITSSMNSNKYRLIVTESTCGSINSDPASLTVNNLPVVSITATPSTVVMPGQTVTLTATSTTTANTYSWYNNGAVITGQSGNSITVNDNGMGTYAVSVTDNNGCSSNSNNLIIRDTILNYTFIYPNPNRGHFQVRFEGIPYNGQPRYITMYDAKGARVFQKAYNVSSSFEPMDVTVEKFSSGVYMLVLSDLSGNTLAKGKVVIQ